jgi:uncharacterized integral membrane protein
MAVVSRFYLYHVSMLTIGIFVGVPALMSSTTGEQSISILLQAIGGCGMAIAALYGIFTKDATDFTVGKYAVWTVVLAALLVLLSHVIHIVN